MQSVGLLCVCLVVALVAVHSIEARRRERLNLGGDDDGGGGAEEYPQARRSWLPRARGRDDYDSPRDVDATDKLLNLEVQMEEMDLRNDNKRTKNYSPQRRRVITMLSNIFQRPPSRRELYDWRNTRWLMGERALIITRSMEMNSPADQHKIGTLPSLPKCLSLMVNRRWEHYPDVSFPWGCCYMDVFGLIERCWSQSDPGSTPTTKRPNGDDSLSTTWRPTPVSSSTKRSRPSTTTRKSTQKSTTKRARGTSTTSRRMTTTTLSAASTTTTTTSGPEAEPTSPAPVPEYEDLRSGASP